MRFEIDRLTIEFLHAAGDSKIHSVKTGLELAPHTPPKLVPGHGAIYLFQLAKRYERGDVESERVLKVGKAGPTSNARFQYQHYNPSAAGSTLAGSLLTNPALWPYLGIEALNKSTVKDWILQNTTRQHVYLDPDQYRVHAPALERYIRGVTGPVFEG